MGDDLEARVRRTCQRLTDDGTIPGAAWALVTGRGSDRRVHIESCGAYDDDTIFRIASVTKSIVGVLTARLIAAGELDLDAPVGTWVPEVADRPVLRNPAGPLDDVVPAERALTVRDVVAMGAGIGWGAVLEGGELTTVVAEQGLESTWLPSELDPGEWARRAGALPMAHQPGEGWLYQMSYDLLTIVIERAVGTPIDDLLAERVLHPLGMTETGWTVDPDRLGRVPAQFFPNRAGRAIQVAPAGDPKLTQRPTFCSAATGLHATAGDLAVLGASLLDDLPAGLTDDLRSPAAARMSEDTLGTRQGWGMGVGVDLVATLPGSNPGRFGWDGGTGTTMWTDPAAGTSAVMLTQAGMGGIDGADYLDAFWRAVHA